MKENVHQIFMDEYAAIKHKGMFYEKEAYGDSVNSLRLYT